MGKDIRHITPVTLGAIVCILLFLSAVTPGCMAPKDTTGTPASPQASILVYAGAGLKAPMEEIAKEFTREYGIGVQYTYAGSGVLITQMNLTKKGDVFITGSTVEYSSAMDKGLVGPYQLVAYHVPVIAVQKGNPKNITSVQDFSRPGLKIALGDINATAIGKAGAKMFKKLNITDAVEKNVVTRTPTINELTVLVNTGQIDATLLTLDQVNNETMEAIPIPNDVNEVLIIPIGVTTFSENQDNARKFADFVASDEGKAIFAKHGFPKYPDPAYADVKP
jgi:molybdate transport system substrate-binding protein